MFRALPCSSSGGPLRNCIHAVSGIVTVCRWLSCAVLLALSVFEAPIVQLTKASHCTDCQYTQSCFCYHSLELYTLHRPLLTIFSRPKHDIMTVNTCKPIFRKTHSSYTWPQHSNVEIPKVIETWIMLSRILTTVRTKNNTAALWYTGSCQGT